MSKGETSIDVMGKYRGRCGTPHSGNRDHKNGKRSQRGNGSNQNKNFFTKEGSIGHKAVRAIENKSDESKTPTYWDGNAKTDNKPESWGGNVIIKSSFAEHLKYLDRTAQEAKEAEKERIAKEVLESRTVYNAKTGYVGVPKAELLA